MHAARLTLILAATTTLACGAGNPKPVPMTATARPPAPMPTASVPTCMNGKFIAPGESMRADYWLLGTAPKAPAPVAAAVVRAACTASDGIRACLDAAKERDGAPYDGNAAFDLTINANGKATAKPSASMADGNLLACLQTALATAAFAKDTAGTTRYELQLRPRLHLVKMVEFGTEVNGIRAGLAKGMFREKFKSFRQCYEQFVARRGLVDGSVSFDLKLRADGTVSALNVDPSYTFKDDALLWCFADVVKILQFDGMDSPAATINYSIRFSVGVE
jgi:hypothetical protein